MKEKDKPMTTDNDTNEHIPPEHMVSAEQDILNRWEIIEYLALIEIIEVNGTYKGHAFSGPMYITCPRRGRCIILATHQETIAAGNKSIYGPPNTDKCISIGWPTDDKVQYRTDGFSMRGVDFGYVAQRNCIRPLPPTAQEAEQRKRASDERQLQYYFGGSEERRKAAEPYMGDGFALLDIIRTMTDLVYFLESQPNVRFSGYCEGRRYENEEVRIRVTEKYFWLNGYSGRLLRPKASEATFWDDGVSFPGGRIHYMMHPSDVRLCMARMRARWQRRHSA
jgi:hypothetical protein